MCYVIFYIFKINSILRQYYLFIYIYIIYIVLIVFKINFYDIQAVFLLLVRLGEIFNVNLV